MCEKEEKMRWLRQERLAAVGWISQRKRERREREKHKNGFLLNLTRHLSAERIVSRFEEGEYFFILNLLVLGGWF